MLSSFRQRSSVQFVARTDSYINECIKIYMCWLSAFRSTCRSIAPEANKVLPVLLDCVPGAAPASNCEAIVL